MAHRANAAVPSRGPEGARLMLTPFSECEAIRQDPTSNDTRLGLVESGRPDSNRRPPEPHSEQEPGQIRRNVAFTRCYGRPRRI